MILHLDGDMWKQAESVARYRLSVGEPTPETKKQAEFAVRYRLSAGEPTPETKKQAESAVR